MQGKLPFMIGGCCLIITLVIVVIGVPGKAQNTAGPIHEVLATVVDERIPKLTENGFWGYTLPDSARYMLIDDPACPGELVYLHGERWLGDEIKLWGAMSIQTCPSEGVAAEMVTTYQPTYLDAIYENIVMVSTTEQRVQELSSQGIDLVDSLDYACRDPIIIIARDCTRTCKVTYPILQIYYDDYDSCYEEWKDLGCELAECVKSPDDPRIEICKYFHDDDRLLRECLGGCQQKERMDLENCSGTSDLIHINVWSNGNHLFMAQAPIFVGMNLGTVLEGCQDCVELSDILKEEADKAGMSGASGQQPVPAEPAAPIEFVAQIGIIPNPPVRDQETTFTVDVRGGPAGEGLNYSWYLDGTLLCQSQTCRWQATSGSYTIHVVVESKLTKRQAENALRFDVSDRAVVVVDNARAGFTIDYLGCSGNITSDETLACTLGFTRQAQGIEKLTVVWLIDGLTAATESRSDNGSVFSIDKPAPGTHTIEVQVIDPQTGMARVKQAVVDVLEGSNVALPPGAQTGAAIGTMTGLGGWLWSEWFLRRRAGKLTPAPKKYTVEKEDPGEVKYEVEKEETDVDKKKYDVEVDQEKKKDKRVDVEVDLEKSKGYNVEIDQKKDKTEAKESARKSEEVQKPGKQPEEEAGSETVNIQDLYNSTRVGDFMLGGSLPEDGNNPIRAPSTWSKDSELWNALTKHMTEEQRAKFMQDLKDKYKTVDAGLTALRALRAANKTLQTAEGLQKGIADGWRWGTGAADGEHDIIFPDPVSSFVEPLIKDGAIEDRIGSLKQKYWEKQTFWEKIWYGQPKSREDALEYIQAHREALDNYGEGQPPPATDEEAQQFADEYQRLVDLNKRLQELIDDSDFE